MNNRKIISLFFIFIIIYLLIGWFIFRPMAGSILQVHKEIKIVDEQIKNVEEKKNILTKNRANKAEFDQLYQKANLFLPEKIDTSNFIISLDKISAVSNQKQTSISFAAASAKKSKSGKEEPDQAKTSDSSQTQTMGSLKEAGVSVSQTGSFPNFLGFLQDFENKSRLSSIENLSITTTEENLSITWQGKIFYKPGITIEKNLANLEIKEKEGLLKLEETAAIIATPPAAAGRSDPFAQY